MLHSRQAEAGQGSRARLNRMEPQARRQAHVEEDGGAAGCSWRLSFCSVAGMPRCALGGSAHLHQTFFGYLSGVCSIRGVAARADDACTVCQVAVVGSGPRWWMSWMSLVFCSWICARENRRMSVAHVHLESINEVFYFSCS